MKKSRWALLIGAGVLVAGISTAAATSSSAPDNTLPFEKQQIENNYQKLKDNAATPAPKSTDTSLKPVHHDPLPHGILNQFTPPFHSEDVTVSNVWQTEIGDELIQVYAGNVALDQQQGVVIIRDTAADGYTVTEKRFFTPEKVGALKIVSANNMKLIAKDAKGGAYVFDVNAKTLNKQ